MTAFDGTSPTATGDVLLLGAAGSSGRLIAAELAARGLPVRLAGRHRGPLEDLAGALAGDGATTQVCTVDVDDAASLAEAITGAGAVVSAVGPFARHAGAVIDCCLAARVAYVDIANEWRAVHDLLERDGQARAREVVLVTGAGFGPAATEALVLRLVAGRRTTPTRVRVAAAARVAHRGDAVRRTVEESRAEGAVTYRDGLVVHEPLGTGVTIVDFGGEQRRVMPAPVGDLVTARRASGAADVVAYLATPATDPAAGPASGGQQSGSWAWAEVRTADGHVATAELETGDGVRATAAIAAETTRRVLTGAPPGAWTPGRLFGAALVTDATGARVTVDGRPAG